MSEKQREVKEIAANIVILTDRPNWHPSAPIVDAIANALQTERDRAERAESAIRKHRDQRGDDRCWMDDEELYASLPEGYVPPLRDSSVELKNCQRFIDCRNNPATIYVSPERMIETLCTRAEKAEYVAKTAQQAAIIRVEEVNAGFDALLERAEKAELQRNNLLCRIHRDGGHYIQAHGVEKACEDADLIVAQLNCEHDALAEGT